MSRTGSITICFLLLSFLAAAASADTRWHVVRYNNYEHWKRLEARLDRSEARTELLRARARAVDGRRLLDQARLEAIAEDRTPEGARTHGRACIYGRNDELLYAPAGKRC